VFEEMTTDNLQITLLGNIGESYEKSPGFPTYDILKSFAIEENKLYLILQNMMDMLDVDLLTGGELTKYVLQRKGIVRKLATNSLGIVTVTGTGNITIGDLFSTVDNIQFVADESVAVVTTGEIIVKAVVEGITGNLGANSITLMPVTLAGIVSCNNSLPTSGGYEAESDDSVRTRYYEALRLPSNSGNAFNYLTWAKSISGVGDAKVLSLWNGANTVKVVIIDSNKQVASANIVLAVQNYIDPNSSGIGEGQAPIGAYCTVTSATGKAINIVVDIQEDTAYTLAEVLENVEANITTYLQEIAFKQSYVSYARLGLTILNTVGVMDYTTLTVNGTTTNIVIGNEEVAILGSVVVN